MAIAQPYFELTGSRETVFALLRTTWRSRDVIRVLARKEFYVRYRRTSFGVLWALALPLVQAGVLAVVLPRLVRFETAGSYVAFVFSGTVVWMLFVGSVTSGSSSIVDHSTLSSRVYFPRVALPLAIVLSNVYMFLPAAAVLLIVTVATGSAGLSLLLIVPGTALAIGLTTAVSALLAALHVYFRDIRYLVQAGLLVLFYVTPIIYPLRAVGSLRGWLQLNPLTGVVELFHAATVGTSDAWPSVTISLAWTVVLTVAGLVLHVRHDRLFADLL